MPFTSNRFVLVVCTKKTANGNTEPDDGTCINVDVVGLSEQLIEAMRQYEVFPLTPQYSFGQDRPTMYLRWDTAEEAVAAAYPWGLWEFAVDEVDSIPVA